MNEQKTDPIDQKTQHHQQREEEGQQQPQVQKKLSTRQNAAKQHMTVGVRRSDQSQGEQHIQLTSARKQDLNLPFLPNHSNFGDRIFPKQSASTLQKTILVFSIPKARRFGNDPKYNGEPSYCIDSCFKPSPSKGAGFGFGSKKQFPDWMQRNMKENPAPGSYFDSLMRDSHKGPTFGISHKYYQKVMIPKQKNAEHNTARKLSPLHLTK